VKIIKKIRNNRKWFIGTLATLATALVAVLVALFFIPEAKASAIVDDPVGKTLTYNLPVIAAQNAGNLGVVEVEIDITDPDYKYYIIGDSNTYNNISLVVNYELSVSKVVPIYLDNVKINMSENAPAMSFTTSTNENTGTDGGYKIIVKGDCAMTSSCIGATYPVIQVESVGADLYQLVRYNGEDYLNPENYYTMVKASFDTNVEFTSYEFAQGETVTECSLTVENATNSYGAAIGTTAGTVDITGDNIVLSDGTGTPIQDIGEDGPLMKIFNKPLKIGAQALYGSSGYTGDVTISGALNLTVISNGYGACIGGGGSYIVGKEAKNAGNVTINGGTLYLATNDVVSGGTTYPIPAIGGGFNSAGNTYGEVGNVVISGGSIYIRDNGMQFGAADKKPVNAKGEALYQFVTDYTTDIDENGKLVISSERYEEIHRADFTENNGYIDVDYQYNSKDFSTVLNYNYEGFGHTTGNIGSKLYFYLPATPLCKLTISEESYLDNDIPIVSATVGGLPVDFVDGAFWIQNGSDVLLTFKDIPKYMDVQNIVLTDVKTNVTSDYTQSFVYDETTGNYVVTVKVSDDSELNITYASDIRIEYNYGFVDGDTHEIVNNLPVKYELGDDITLSDSDIFAADLAFVGWYSELTGDRITSINSSNLYNIMDATGAIKLKAKWNVTVTYDMGEGNGDEIPVQTLPYGEAVDLIITNVQPTLDFYLFEGWVVEGVLCGPGYTHNLIPTKNIVITASYIQSNYFVYIDASPKKFNIENVDIFVGIDGTTNNLILKNPDGTYRTTEIEGVTYYQAVVENEDRISVILTQKPGLIISGQSVTVTQGSGKQVVVGTGGSENGEITIQFTIDEDDVYISTASEFVLREYEISFFDGISGSTGNKLWTGDKFTYTIEELDKSIGEILGNKVSEIDSVNTRFFKFAGWEDVLTGKVYSNEDSFGENLGDVILVAKWTKIDKYPINVTVIDERYDEVSEDVFALPYYVNADGSYEEPYIEDGIAYAKENDKIVIKFFYYDNNGDVKDVTNGVILKAMELKYTKNTGSNTTEEIAPGVDFFICPKPMDETPINVRATIDIQEYTITYWDTREMIHGNPETYTFFDEVVLNKIYGNVDWLLVVPDDDENNFDDIKTVPIEKIERGTMGNLVIKADWSDYSEEYYTVNIDSIIKNGTLEIIYPVGRDEYMANETLVIKVTPNKGYQLKDGAIIYREVPRITFYGGLGSTFGYANNLQFDSASQITGKDGIYLVNMPENDVFISAEFVMANYTITYNNVDGLDNNNATTFTYFDTIKLNPVEKDGFKFLGWVDANGNTITTIKEMESDISLTATFEELVPDDDENVGDEGNDKDNPNKDDSDKDNSDKNDGNSGETNKPSNKPGTGNTDSDNNDKNDSNVNINLGNPSVNDTPSNSEDSNKKPHIIGGGNAYGSDTYTGDTSNVTRMVLISVAAVIMLIILVLTKEQKNEEIIKKS